VLRRVARALLVETAGKEGGGRARLGALDETFIEAGE